MTIIDGWLDGAIRRPLTVDKKRKLLTEPRRANCHIAVTEAASLFNTFNRITASDSHFYVRRGTPAQIADPNGMADFEQYVPTTHRANADYEGNDATYSIESQGGVGSDAAFGQWDAAQLRRISWIWKTLRDYYRLPNRLVTTPRYGAEENKGLGWHRIGIDSRAGSWVGELGGRLQRGALYPADPNYMHWSLAWGKTCPGDERIKQVKLIFAMANDAAVTPTPPPPPAQLPKREPRRIPTIDKGDKGELVVIWQRVLKMGGYYIGAAGVDGDFWTATHNATVKWQTDRGLVGDGQVGPRTWTRALTADPSGTLAAGDFNAAVMVLQLIIGETTDGDFGPRTGQGTEEVQRFLGVTPDRVVGNGTAGALLNWWI